MKDAAAILDVAPTKVTQAIGPAFIKVARLMLADPARTMAELLATMNDLNRDHRAFDTPESKHR